MAKESGDYEVPMSGTYYVVGAGEVADQPSISGVELVALRGLRAEFIERWSKPRRFPSLTAKEIEGMGGLLTFGDEPSSDRK